MRVAAVSAFLTPLNQRAPNANSLGGFAQVFESGVLDEKNNFSSTDDFSGSGRFRAGSGTRPHTIAGAGSFKCNAGYSGRCRSAAPASAIAHRDGENVATASERPAGRVGQGRPHG